MANFPTPPVTLHQDEESRFRRYLEQELESIRGLIRQKDPVPVLTVEFTPVWTNDDNQVMHQAER